MERSICLTFNITSFCSELYDYIELGSINIFCKVVFITTNLTVVQFSSILECSSQDRFLWAFVHRIRLCVMWLCYVKRECTCLSKYTVRFPLHSEMFVFDCIPNKHVQNQPTFPPATNNFRVYNETFYFSLKYSGWLSFFRWLMSIPQQGAVEVVSAEGIIYFWK